ncbi:hypothetical protein BDN70DRAFT_877483 [Pholiota conissans]|uniref:Uncharacterized protein n=1 Tax=Pholiota conissans TaxID=109636 RepID=A0A9P6CUF8_9AGAR|nr:hypothetical protein BDN70DRAFT_877483 [Pholiota conissans]
MFETEFVSNITILVFALVLYLPSSTLTFLKDQHLIPPKHGTNPKIIMAISL